MRKGYAHWEIAENSHYSKDRWKQSTESYIKKLNTLINKEEEIHYRIYCCLRRKS